KLFADGRYQGPDFQKALARILPQLETEIVKRSDRTKGFVVLPRRWIVERTFAWLNRCRRLAKDWENINRNALAFLRLHSIRYMISKLYNPARCFQTDSKNNYSYYKQYIHMYYIYDTKREFCLKRRQISSIQRQTKAVIGDCSDIRPRRARSLRPRPTVPRCP